MSELKINIVDRKGATHTFTEKDDGAVRETHSFTNETLKTILLDWFITTAEGYQDLKEAEAPMAYFTDKISIEQSYGICGGFLACGSCHVYLDLTLVNTVPAMSIIEKKTLEHFAVEIKENSRLACQLTVDKSYNNRTIYLAPTPPEEKYGLSQEEIDKEDRAQFEVPHLEDTI